MAIEFSKYQALGNDYLVIDPNKTPFPLSPKTVRLICDRHQGVGSDGLLYGPIQQGPTLHVRIFNPDGSEAEKSGNGTRIFAKYLIDTGYVTDTQFTLQTAGGPVRIEVLDRDATQFRTDMGTVTYQSEAIPVSGKPREVVNERLRVDRETCWVTCLSIGNPHCVIPMKDISRSFAMRLGPLIESHAMFPNRINVQFMKVLDRHTIEIEIWERGAGYTLASGSSSCAAASAAQRLGLVESPVTVHMPGGSLAIELKPDGHVLMTGPAFPVMTGQLSPELWKRLQAAEDARPR